MFFGSADGGEGASQAEGHLGGSGERRRSTRGVGGCARNVKTTATPKEGWKDALGRW